METTDANEIAGGDFHLGRFWHELDDGRVQCDLCPRYCRLREGQRGHCFVRANENGAVVLTTATTIMGLLPLLLETSAQAMVFKGLVVSIMFGELFSTAMILVLVPCSYSVLHDFGLIRLRPSPR